MLSVPKRANDAMHLSMLEGEWTHTDTQRHIWNGFWWQWMSSGFDENIESQGELILQEAFQVWDPKTLIRKGRERHLFLFEMSLIFSKEVKDSNGRSKYIYKSKLFVSFTSRLKHRNIFLCRGSDCFKCFVLAADLWTGCYWACGRRSV